MKATIPILAKGTFPHATKVVQVIDDESLRAIEQQAIPPEGLLLDFDHYSDLAPEEIAKLKEMGIQLPSEAAGWIHGITRVGDRLFAAVDLTAAGEAAIEGKNYVFTSPVFDRQTCVQLEGRQLRPTAIKKIALTNEPNIRAIGAIRNRAGEDAADASPGEILFPIANRDGAEPEPKTPNKEKTMLKKLATILGCEESEEAVEAAAKKLTASLKETESKSEAAKEEADKAKAEKADLENKAAEAQAEADKAKADKAEAEKKAAEDMANCAEQAKKDAAEKETLKNEKDAAEAERDSLKNRVAELEGQIAEKDKNLFDAKVKAELDKYPDLKNREEAEAVLRSNFDAGCKFLASMPKAAPAKDPRPYGANPGDLANRAGEGEGKDGAVGIDRLREALQSKN